MNKFTIFLMQSFCNHDIKRGRLYFYCVDEYPKFKKLWQYLYICKKCGKDYKPKFFSLRWRLKYRFTIFSEDDLKLNLSEKEIIAYNSTKKLIHYLETHNKNGQK